MGFTDLFLIAETIRNVAKTLVILIKIKKFVHCSDICRAHTSLPILTDFEIRYFLCTIHNHMI